MGRTISMLHAEGFNFRERFNIYAGFMLGAAAPVAGLRYIMAPPVMYGQDNPLVMEAIAWGISGAINVGMSVASTAMSAPGFPMLYTALIGGMVGFSSAKKLRRKRMAREEVRERSDDGSSGLIACLCV